MTHTKESTSCLDKLLETDLMNEIAPPRSKMSARTEWTNQYSDEPVKCMEDLGYTKTTGTEPMNTTTVKTTDRTADDLMKAVREGKYVTNNGDYIVSSGYKSIRVAVNPLNSLGFRGNDDKSMHFTEDALIELTSILNIVTADRNIANAEDTKEWAVDSLNSEAKGK